MDRDHTTKTIYELWFALCPYGKKSTLSLLTLLKREQKSKSLNHTVEVLKLNHVTGD